MSIASRLRRTRVGVEDGPDDVDDIRVYFDPEDEMSPAPSVSVIKALRDDPEKAESLQGWRDRYNGRSQWARPWYKDQKIYKGYRGTLIHYTILSALASQATAAIDGHDPDSEAHLDASGDTYFHQVGDDGYGYEEYEAEYALKKWSKHAPSANTEEVPGPQDNEYDGEHAWDRAVREMRWAGKTFKSQYLDTGHIDPATVLAIEAFVCNPEHSYAGQFDLLYERDGETILADLKTSSAIRFDHKLQTAAYASAVEHCLDIDVDACEIIRLHPDKEVHECSHSSDWDRSIEGLQYEFFALAERSQITYDEALTQAREKLSSEHAESAQQELAADD